MQLTCHKCHHHWDEPVDPGQPVVQCPECMVIVPIALASGGAPVTAPKPAAPPPPPPAPAESMEDLERTVINRPSLAATPPPELEQTLITRATPATASHAEELDQTTIQPGGLWNFVCNKCHHAWTDELEPGQPVIQCPECMALVPIVLAKKSPAGKSAQVKPANLEATLIERKTAPPPPPEAKPRSREWSIPLDEGPIGGGAPSIPPPPMASKAPAFDDDLGFAMLPRPKPAKKEEPAKRDAKGVVDPFAAGSGPSAAPPGLEFGLFVPSDVEKKKAATPPPPTRPAEPTPPPPSRGLRASEPEPAQPKQSFQIARETPEPQAPPKSRPLPAAPAAVNPADDIFNFIPSRPGSAAGEPPPAQPETRMMGPIVPPATPPRPEPPPAFIPETRVMGPIVPPEKSVEDIFDFIKPPPVSSTDQTRIASRPNPIQGHEDTPLPTVAGLKIGGNKPKSTPPPPPFEEEAFSDPLGLFGSEPPPPPTSKPTRPATPLPPAPTAADELQTLLGIGTNPPPLSGNPIAAFDALAGFDAPTMPPTPAYGKRSQPSGPSTPPPQTEPQHDDPTIVPQYGRQQPPSHIDFAPPRRISSPSLPRDEYSPPEYAKTEVGGITPTPPGAVGGGFDDFDFGLPPTPPPKHRSPAVPSALDPGWESQEVMPSWMSNTAPSGSGDQAEAPTAMDEGSQEAGKTLGGYQISKKLGQGGMGEVYLARQISLDRNVALKVLPARFSRNPEFLMRFTREALSAAQLTHHNVVQVIDVGAEGDTHFISMEFVKGENLGDVVRRDGKMDPEAAVAFVLQAARGLKFAHENGIIHRDIKPDNLMVNEHGIVKVADMGLAKMRGEAERNKGDISQSSARLNQARGDITMNEIAMGTPAYMPPEQARDATSVDARADQYSLGCTLYYMLAGKTPFTGGSAMELISKHLLDPPPPLSAVVKGIPTTLNQIVSRMLEKDPEARYPRMGDAIRDLEAFLGVQSEKGPYAPQERHVEVLEVESSHYYAVGLAKMRTLCGRGFFVVLGALVLLLPFLDGMLASAACLGFLALMPVVNFVVGGMMQKSYMFRRTRSVLFGMTAKGWGITLGSCALAAGLFWIFQPVSYFWAGFGVFAALLSFLYQKFILRKLKAQRAPYLDAIQDMLKSLRIRGVSEEALQNFIYRYSGADWEELFEDLFGYSAMIAARGRWAAADQMKPRHRFATWREPVMHWLDGVEESRREAHERKLLAKAEASRLKARGMDEKAAEKKAKELAAEMVNDGLLRTETALGPLGLQGGKAGRRARQKEAAKSSARRAPVTKLGRLMQFGRIGLGVVMLAPFIMDKAGMGGLPLPLPEAVLHGMMSTWGLVAGAAVLLAGFSVGRFMPYLVIAGAALVVGGPYIVPQLELPNFNEAMATFTGLGAIAAGLGMCILSKMSGGKF